MRCKACGSHVIFARSNGKRIKIVDEEIDIDYEDTLLTDFIDFQCGACSSAEIDGIEKFLEKINKEHLLHF